MMSNENTELAGPGGYFLGTALQETRSNTPDMTFAWNITSAGNAILVTVNYGGGDDQSNQVSAKIPLGSATAVNMPNNGGPIYVAGTVQAFWSQGNASAAVVFSGQMVRPNFSNVYSVSNGILVGAYIGA